MQDYIGDLKKITRDYQLLSESAAVLAWDQETYLPPKAVQERGEQLAQLQSLAHSSLTSPRVGELLAACGCGDDTPGGTAGEDPADVAYLRQVYRAYTRQIRIPSSLIESLARSTSAAQAAWAEARKRDDFSLFQPHLKEVLSLVVEKAQAVGYGDHPYDALIDEFEPWMTTAEVSRVFKNLESSLKNLASRIAERPQVDDTFLHRTFSIEKQREFARRVVQDLGFDLSRGRIDETAHPFTTTLGAHDVRITGRFREDYFGTGLFGLIHETGHALYEQGFDRKILGNILATGTSLGIHESQSRTWENVVGRSRAFWEHYLPLAREYFPSQLNKTGLEQFYRGINKVSPTNIRIDADEVTYGLHIILRFRLELAMVSGELKVEDLPGAWREASRELLGIEPETSAEGELQDIHWSMGAIGYFPTYALGNLYGAQFWSAFKRKAGDVDTIIREGDFTSLRNWHRESIHCHGASKTAGELCMEVSGEALKAEYLQEYLENKFRSIYTF
jgi:carboxypeptidase Taq